MLWLHVNLFFCCNEREGSSGYSSYLFLGLAGNELNSAQLAAGCFIRLLCKRPRANLDWLIVFGVIMGTDNVIS